MFIKFVTFALILLYSSSLLSHGMNKPGPHNGYIRMPGAFHVELVDGNNQYQVYLLDINFKKLNHVDSSVSIIFKGKQNKESSCRMTNEFFVCEKPKNEFIEFQEILIKTILKNKIEKVATYRLPLEYK